MKLRPEAEMDVASAADWYEAQRMGLGREFLDCVEAVLNQITERPRLFAEGYRGVRRVGTRRFPYVVYYRFENDEPVVLAVLHAKRHPHEWRRRS